MIQSCHVSYYEWGLDSSDLLSSNFIIVFGHVFRMLGLFEKINKQNNPSQSVLDSNKCQILDPSDSFHSLSIFIWFSDVCICFVYHCNHVLQLV